MSLLYELLHCVAILTAFSWTPLKIKGDKAIYYRSREGAKVMLVILTDQQVISPKQVCQGCLLANTSGLPRWQNGKLGCGNALSQVERTHPAVYECKMGFRLTNID